MKKKFITVFIAISIMTTCLGYAALAAAYPPNVDYSEEEKEMQRLSAATINAELATCIEQNENYFNIPSGEYRFNNSSVGAFLVKNAQDLVIDCSDAIFYSESTDHIIQLSNCKNVTLKNLKIDYDPLPYLQGVIKGIDKENKVLTVEFDEGYPLPDKNWIKNAGSIMKFLYFSPDGNSMVSSQKNFDSPFLEWVGTYDSNAPSIKCISDRTYEIKLLRGYAFEEDSLVSEGYRFAIPWRKNRAVFLFGCENVTMENVDMYAFPGYCINEVYGNGGNTYRNINIIRRPGTDRLISGNADAFHSSCMVKGPVIENCHWEFPSDDFINIRGYYNVVTEIGDDYLKIASPYPFAEFGDNRTFRVGDDLEFYKYTDKEFKLLDSITVTEIEDLSSTETILPSELASAFNAHTGGKIREGIALRLFKVKFNAPVSNITNYAVCFSRNCVGSGAIIRNNDFHDNLSRGVLMRGDNALIYNNTFTRNGMSSVLIYGEASALEAGLPQNTVVKGNQIYYSNYLGGGYDVVQSAAINANLKQTSDSDTGILGKGIDISDNYIFGCNISAIVLNKYEDSAVYGNKVYNALCKTSAFNYPFRATYSKGLFDNNMYNRCEADESLLETNDFSSVTADIINGYISEPKVAFDGSIVSYEFYVFGRGTEDFKAEVSVVDADGNVKATYSFENPQKLFGFAKIENRQVIANDDKLYIRAYNADNVIKEYVFNIE